MVSPSCGCRENEIGRWNFNLRLLGQGAVCLVDGEDGQVVRPLITHHHELAASRKVKVARVLPPRRLASCPSQLSGGLVHCKDCERIVTPVTNVHKGTLCVDPDLRAVRIGLPNATLVPSSFVRVSFRQSAD